MSVPKSCSEKMKRWVVSVREIKFRAWDKRNKKWFHEASIIITNNGFYEGYREFEDGYSLFDYEYELIQYTGLKDKNGVEIYEGDIIQADDSGTFLGDKFYKGFHRYWKKQVVEDIRNCFFKNYTSNIEVIGNIYENPELLEVPK